MEDVEGMMRGLKLSAAEKRGRRIGVGEREKESFRGTQDPQAVGKLFSERSGHATMIGQTLGRIWCPIKGLVCKELGENVFLFTFRQSAGCRRALEDGPWWFEKELLVMEEYDPEKTVDEYEFKLIPMWIRVFGLPLGSMNRATGELIGEDFHELVDVDVGIDGTAVGKYMRVKVKLDISEPLMRGFLLDREEKQVAGGIETFEEGNKKKKKNLLWYRFEYGHLPDFCYTCGIIGHGEKECNISKKKGEAPQFGPWMRAEEEGKRGDDGARSRWSDGKGSNNSRSFGGARNGPSATSYGDRRQFSFGSGGWKSGSDGPSWRKDGTESRNSGKSSAGGEKEVPSPLRISGGGGNGGNGVAAAKLSKFSGEGRDGENEKGEGEKLADQNSMQVDVNVAGKSLEVEEQEKEG